MSIELRSLNGINRACVAINDGDYVFVRVLNIRLHHPYFTSASLDDFVQDLGEMMQAVGQVPDLRTLDIRPVVDDKVYSLTTTCRLPVASLARALEHAKGLTTLAIVNVCLTGRQEDFLQLAKALEGHGSLQVFQVECGFRKLGDWTDYDLETTNPLDPVYKALATIPTLTTLYTGGRYEGEPKKETIAELCELSKVRDFQAFNWLLTDDMLATLATQLKSNKSRNMTKFWVCCTPLAARGCEKLVELILADESKLGDIFIHVKNVAKGEDPKRLLGNLTAAIGKSKIKNFQFNGREPFFPVALESIKLMLRTNYILEKVTLQQFRYGSWVAQQDNEINFLLKTNILGRGELFKNQGEATRDVTWMDLFEATEGELDNIFYLVRSHPNEFAQMGLADEAENMLPTTRSMKALLRQNKKGIEKLVQHLICESTSAMEDTILDGFDCHIQASREETLVALEKSVNAVAEDVEVYKEETLNAVEKSVKTLLRQSRKGIKQSVRAAIDKSKKDMEKSVQAMTDQNKKEMQNFLQTLIDHQNEKDAKVVGFGLKLVIEMAFLVFWWHFRNGDAVLDSLAMMFLAFLWQVGPDETFFL